MTDDSRTSTLHFNEEKKHSVRYDAPKTDSDPTVSSVYVLKSALMKPYPMKIEITITRIDS